jgi:hydroxyacylglutathione hydrolase
VVQVLSSAMNIEAFPSGPFDTNAYVAVCPYTKQTAIIDPAPDSYPKIYTYLTDNQWIPSKILLTHSHWDHIADTAKFKNTYNIPVYIHALDAPNLENPGADLLPCWIPIQGVHPDGFLNENDEINIGRLIFKVIHTPGHTPGGICLYCKDQNVLFSGDTLFRGTIGNLSFPTARPQLMWDSLDKLNKLPPKTKVYPGHGPSTTIAEETWLPKARELFEDSY